MNTWEVCVKALTQVTVSYARLLRQFWLDHGVSSEALDGVLSKDINDNGLGHFCFSDCPVLQINKADTAHVQNPLLWVKLGLHMAKQSLVIKDLILIAPTFHDGMQALVEYSELLDGVGLFSMLSERK